MNRYVTPVFGLLACTLLLAACNLVYMPPPTATPLPVVTPAVSIHAARTPTAPPAPAATAEPVLTLSGYVGGTVLIALDAARSGQWKEVEEELEEAIELSLTAQERQLFTSMLATLRDGDTASVLAQLVDLAESIASEPPLLIELDDSLRFARLGDWKEVREEITEAMNLTNDEPLLRAMQEIVADIDREQYDEALQDIERLVHGVGDEDPALPTLQQALAYARHGDWEQTRVLLETAVQQTQDSQHQARIIEILDDLERADHEEVLSDLAVLVGSHEMPDPVTMELERALAHALHDEWALVADNLTKALGFSHESAQEQAIQALLQALDENRHQEVIEGLQQMLALSGH
ncbi:MAG: hypothetical protein D6775_07395 [Caldilineae bacterium]|nr:MAG: hypothetical protein D6775_07395 [Caldilineae bacterium]